METESNSHLASEIEKEIGKLGPPLSKECCIYRVPEEFRKLNEAAYTPGVISIGPFHHGEESLKKMEKYKLRSVEKLLQQSSSGLQDFISLIRDEEQRIRNCYAETFDNLNSDQFVKMVLMDAAFIIVHFVWGTSVIDFPLDKPSLRCCIFNDLALIENQLPFYILENLYAMTTFPSLHPHQFPSFLHVSRDFYSHLDHNPDKPLGEVKHITDLLRSFLLNDFPTQQTQNDCFPSCDNQSKPILSKAKRWVSCFSQPVRSQGEDAIQIHPHSATQLHAAGIMFKKSSSKCLNDVKFSGGKLVIPRLKVFDGTESYIRNLMALEQCHYPDETTICHYFYLMDGLVDTEKDVQLLVERKIVYNMLGDDQAVANLMNSLCTHVLLDTTNEYFPCLTKELNAYYEVPYHRWRAALKQEYFKTPWRGASTVAAIIFLVLTLIQTIYSVKSG